MVEVKQQFAYLTGLGKDFAFTGKDRHYVVNPSKITNTLGRPIPPSTLRLYLPAVLTVPDIQNAHVINAMIREETQTAFFLPILPIQVVREKGDFSGFKAARVVNQTLEGIYEVVLVGYVEWMVKNRHFHSEEHVGEVENIETALTANCVLTWSSQEFEFSGQNPAYMSVWTVLRAFLSSLHASQGSSYLPPASHCLHAASLFGVSLKVHTAQQGSVLVCEQDLSRPELDIWVGDQYCLLLYKEDQVRQLPFDLWTRQPTEWTTLQTMLLEMILELGNWTRVRSDAYFRKVFSLNDSANLYTRLSRTIKTRSDLLAKLCVAIRLCSECCARATTVVLICGRSLCAQCLFHLAALSDSSTSHNCGQATCSLTGIACQSCYESNPLIKTNCNCHLCFLCAVRNEPSLACSQHSIQFPPNVISRLKRQWDLKVPFRTCARCRFHILGNQLVRQLKCRHKVHITHIQNRTRLFCSFCQTFISLTNPK